MSSRNVASIIRENKNIIIIIAIGLFLIELEIFAIAAMKSGRKSWLQFIDAKGNLIYETDGKSLSDFNKYYFEKTFGPLEQYERKLVTIDEPFPFRAWFVSAIGIPIGVVLMLAFIIRAYVVLFHGDELSKAQNQASKDEEDVTRIERLIGSISRFNIFTIGFLIFLVVISYWIIPNLLQYIGKETVETISRYKWIFLSIAIIGVGLVVWIIYLKYLLAKKAIDSQTEIDKYRLQLEYASIQGNMLPQIEYNEGKGIATPLVGWDTANIPESQNPEPGGKAKNKKK